MAKKSAIIGEYIITVEDSGSVNVLKIFDNVKESLRQCAVAKEFEYDPEWTTRQFGSKLIKEFGEGKEATIGEYTIVKRDNESIETYRAFKNTMEGLREVAGRIDFEINENSNTRQNGSKIVDFINSGEAKLKPAAPKAKNSAKTSAEASEEEYILITTSKAGTTFKSHDDSVKLTLTEGENKISLTEYPIFKEGFKLWVDADNITSIDFSHVSRIKAKTLNDMFRSIKNVKKLDLSKIDTSEAEDWWYAFGNCGAEELDLSGWDLSQFDEPELFYAIDKNLRTVIMRNCNAQTIKNVKYAISVTDEIKGKVKVITDQQEFDTPCPEKNEDKMNDFTRERYEEAVSNDEIIVVMKKLDATNAEELYNLVDGEDVQTVVTMVDGDFHYVCDQAPDLDEINEKTIDFDNLYSIVDYVNNRDEFDFDNQEVGIYFPESTMEYYQSDDYPLDYHDACDVLTDALIDDGENHVTYGWVTFNPNKIYVSNGKIIAER